MDEFETILCEIRREMAGRIIAIPGHTPVGRVTKVEKSGALLECGGRIAIEGLVFYHPVEENRRY